MVAVESIPIAIGGLAAGIGIAWFFRGVFGIKSGAVLLVVLFVPSIILLITNNRVEIFKAAGFFEVSFRELATEPVSTDASARIDTPQEEISGRRLVDAGDILAAGASGQSFERMALFAASTSVIIVRSSQWSNVTPDRRLDMAMPIASVIYNSIISGNFQALVVVDDDSAPLGVFESSYFMELLRIPLDVNTLPSEFAEFRPSRSATRAQVLESRLWALLLAPATRAEIEGNKSWLPETSRRIDSLKFMDENGYKVLVTLDEDGSYSGIVTIGDISNRLLLDMFDIWSGG